MSSACKWICIFVLFLNSCSGIKYQYSSLNPEVKSLTNWRTGSYWLMKDSISGRTDSFYVSHFDSSTGEGYDEHFYERISIGIKEVDLLDSSRKTSWWLNVGDHDAQEIEVNCYVNGSDDSAIGYPSFLTCCNAQRDVDFTSNGRTYSHSYVNDGFGGTIEDPNYLKLAISRDSGLVYIAAHKGSYQHVWQLLRSGMKRQ